MIPVTLNTDRMPNDDAGKFFKEAMKSSRWPQGIWIIAPDGKVLAFHYYRPVSGESPERGKARWTRELLEAVETGLNAFGPVKEREVKPHNPLPDRGVGLREDGGARLAALWRLLPQRQARRRPGCRQRDSLCRGVEIVRPAEA